VGQRRTIRRGRWVCQIRGRPRSQSMHRRLMVRSGWRTLVTANHQSQAHAILDLLWTVRFDLRLRRPRPVAPDHVAQRLLAAGMTASDNDERRWAIAHTALDDWWRNGRGSDLMIIVLLGSVFFAVPGAAIQSDAGLAGALNGPGHHGRR
jgi:hypothetical protein